nr:hypothetical protein [Winslowiella iniecta]
MAGIAKGNYGTKRTCSHKNKQYAMNIARYLMSHPETTKAKLWAEAKKGVASPAKNENGQCDVVLGLFDAGLLKVE